MQIAMKVDVVAVILIVFGAAFSFAGEQSGRAGKKTILHAAKMLDVKSGAILSNQFIVIEGDKIASVGPASSVRKTTDVERIELSNSTVLPGLIDCHVHLTGDPNQLDLGPAGLHISYPRRALIGARNARVTLEAGFTTVRNVGADGYSDVALRDAINAGDVPGPRMLVSGPALSITGGHWDENYLAPQLSNSWPLAEWCLKATIRQSRSTARRK